MSDDPECSCQLCHCDPRDQAMALVMARVPPDCPCLRCWALDGLANLMKEQDRFPAGLFISFAEEIGTDDLMAVGHGWDLVIEALDTIVLTRVHTCRETEREVH